MKHFIVAIISQHKSVFLSILSSHQEKTGLTKKWSYKAMLADVINL